MPTKVLRHIPDGIGDEQAAAMAVSGPVAFTQFQVAGFRKGDWVLVTSAASGLGLVTALVAKELGARVIATSRKEWKRDMLKGHGLDGVLDTDSPSFVDQVRELTGGAGVAIAVDNTSSADMFAKLCLVLAPLGRIVSSGALVADTVALDIRTLYLKSQSVIGVRTITGSAGRILETGRHKRNGDASGQGLPACLRSPTLTGTWRRRRTSGGCCWRDGLDFGELFGQHILGDLAEFRQR